MYSTCETIRLDYEKISQNWEQILISLFRLSDSFSVITMASHPYSEHIECVHDPLLEPLIPYLLSQKIGIRKWTGTETRDTHKVMNKYRACAKSRNLLHALGNVFKADLLCLPEDICFYRNGHAIFFTVSHEDMAFLSPLTAADKKAFEEYI